MLDLVVIDKDDILEASFPRATATLARIREKCLLIGVIGVSPDPHGR